VSTERVKIEDIQPGPIRHEQVDALLPVIRWTWRHLKQYLHVSTFEAWELGFTRDTNPGKEVGLWARMAYAFLEFTLKNPGVDKATVYKAIVSISVGDADSVKPSAVRKQLTRLMNDPPRFMADLKNFSADGRLTTDKKHLR
jgi:hypothetical protein